MTVKLEITCSVNEGKSNKSHQGQKDKNTNIFCIHSSLTYRINYLVRYHFPFETNTETDFDIVLMAPHDTKQAFRKRVKI